jgi:hypothetical protein
MGKISCFKAYDVRGRVPGELNEDLAYRIGRAYAAFLSPARVAVGRDVRFSSLSLAEALAAGLNDGGVEVWDLGLCGTEQVYFATSHLGLDGGIMVTASHNPPEYNGMKFVREESRPLSGDSGLHEIERLAAAQALPPTHKPHNNTNGYILAAIGGVVAVVVIIIGLFLWTRTRRKGPEATSAPSDKASVGSKTEGTAPTPSETLAKPEEPKPDNAKSKADDEVIDGILADLDEPAAPTKKPDELPKGEKPLEEPKT